ncbi:B3/4 domain-containing protein [Planosporangium sp. 12N6]|uniref:B3/B4 domain-containing protein n=1 Tax=Planosporangium spinosum TaxID=3402278 RepID=UPI003CF857BA
MYFQHSPDIWTEHPGLVAGVVFAAGVDAHAPVDSRVAGHAAVAEARLAASAVSDLPEIQAWRRTFSRMGLKPTQYRCASEALLRRFAKERALPRIHPVIDLCNAVSLAAAIPVGVFDAARISGYLEVRHADGTEDYLTFSGEHEHPDRREVIFADGAGRAHSRRWTNRQSGHSAVRDSTSTVLVVVEAMHDSAAVDVPELTATIADELAGVWAVSPSTAILSRSAPRWSYPGDYTCPA